MPFCLGNLGCPKDSMVDYFFRGDLLGIAKGWSLQDSNKTWKAFCSYEGNLAAVERGHLQGEDDRHGWVDPQCGGFCFSSVQEEVNG